MRRPQQPAPARTHPTPRRALRRHGGPAVLAALGAVGALLAGCAATPAESVGPVESVDSVAPAPGRTGAVRDPLPAPTVPVIPAPGGATTFRSADTTATIEGCEVFPPDHYMNATGVDRLPVHPESTRWMSSIGGSSASLKFPKTTIWEGARSGTPINVVDSRDTGFHEVHLTAGYRHSYRGGYPIPDSPMVQGHPSAQWDKHLLIVDTAECAAYELIQYDPFLIELTGVRSAMHGVRYPLNSVVPPAVTTNSPNTPMIGQYVTVDEVRRREVPHVLAFCSNTISSDHVWPARMSDGRVAVGDGLPMGSWIRLGDHVDPDSFGPGSRAVVEALRTRGAVLTDSCAHQFSLLAENSAEWDDADMQQIRRLTAADFDVVDSSSMRHDTSGFDYRIR